MTAGRSVHRDLPALPDQSDQPALPDQSDQPDQRDLRAVMERRAQPDLPGGTVKTDFPAL